MKIFLDTADVACARALARWGAFAGATTNPLLLARAGITVERAVAELCGAVGGEIFAQARGDSAAALIADAERLSALAPGRVIVKLPTHEAGLEAMHALADRRIATAATAIFRASQALLAARAGALYAIPFWHRIAEAGGRPEAEVQLAAELFQRLHGSGLRPRLLCASLRDLDQAMAALAAGAHAITVAPAVARALLEHPGTTAAVAQFDAAHGEE
jgi:transaldolase